MTLDWRNIYQHVAAASSSEEKKPMYEDGLMRICKCGRDNDSRDTISECQKNCSHWKAWDAYCYHYRWGPKNGNVSYRDFRGD